MAYTALYRKWRPKVFEDVRGQGPIMTTLRNQVRSGRVGHAYLFCGSRGTGKTTAARILARAINCENPQNGEPCCECASCRSIEAGSSLNVFEIDAASNNGVDNVREILEEIKYPPAAGKYRVYIIDEVHMFSNPAFNALLKSLEEPPEYVVFILATTEPHKLPATILSRCQQYDFHRIGTDVIYDRLRTVCQNEGFSIEDRALGYIARKADGGFRDALSLLDQVNSAAGGEKLTFDRTLQLLGAVETDTLSSFFRLITARDIPSLLLLTEQVSMSGKDLSQFTQDFLWYLRDILIRKTAFEARELLEVSDEDLERLSQDAEAVSIETLMRLIRQYSALYEAMRQTISKRPVFEVGVIRSCMPEADESREALLERLNALEQRLDLGIIPVEQTWTTPVEPAKTEYVPPVAEPVGCDQITPAAMDMEERGEKTAPEPEPVKSKDGELPELYELVPKIDRSLQSYFKRTRAVSGEDGSYIVLFEDDNDLDIARAFGAKEELEAQLEHACGRKIKVSFRADRQTASDGDKKDDIISVFNFDVTETL